MCIAAHGVQVCDSCFVETSCKVCAVPTVISVVRIVPSCCALSELMLPVT